MWSAVKSSAVFSIVPSLPIIISLIAMAPVLGIPFPWIRLSIIGSAPYEILAADIGAKSMGISPDSVVSPYLVLAGTDARKYECVCDSIYRFSPYQIKDEDLSKMHGTNEYISFDNIEKCIKFYIQLIKNFQF